MTSARFHRFFEPAFPDVPRLAPVRLHVTPIIPGPDQETSDRDAAAAAAKDRAERSVYEDRGPVYV